MAQQLDLPKELWTLANIITGFAVVQNIAFGYALAKDLAGLQTGPLKFKLLIAIIALVFAAVYCFAVWRCQAMAVAITPAQEPVWREVTIGRVVAICGFAFIPIGFLFAPRLFPPK